MLQYRNRLLLILTRWKNKLCGQPINQFTGGQIDSNIEDIINKFEDYIYEIQSSALKTMRSKDNALCKNVITKEFNILNLTSQTIPDQLSKVLSFGINFVPHTALPIDDLKKLMEYDLKKAAINFFRDCNAYYPNVNENADFQTVIKQLMTQVPSHSTQL